MDRILLDKKAADNAERNVNAANAVPALKINQLFGGFREIRLFHGSEEYRLRLTRKDKLILTK